MTRNKTHRSRSFHVQWFIERLKQATLMLRECVEIDPQIRGGVPVLRGTRIPVARILADIADGYSPQEVTDDLGLDLDLVKKLLDGLASSIDRPFTT
ncbi:MAG: DUF433 domain-containing protein [Patescibacteria group bacterium]|nr:DUF433 domain-containing protein [Patescibacteria group bacterium]